MKKISKIIIAVIIIICIVIFGKCLYNYLSTDFPNQIKNELENK